MAIRLDPEKNEIRALVEMTNLSGKKILEVGCGDGRLTWHYVDYAKHVTAIDSFEKFILRAKENIPDNLVNRVDFRHQTIEEFAPSTQSGVFDTVILSWSL
jgi:2-polyprenyl-3-methyl-5-hydroxy-6-metoxy-1,4-benzoquinol methylase